MLDPLAYSLHFASDGMGGSNIVIFLLSDFMNLVKITNSRQWIREFNPCHAGMEVTPPPRWNIPCFTDWNQIKH